MFDELVTELMGLSNDELDIRIRNNELQRRRLDTELAAAITIAEHRQLPAVDDHRSINAYLRATINCSSGEASRWRSLARAVDHVDGLGERWVTGRFGISQAVQFATLHGNRRVRGRLPEFTPLLLGYAEGLPYSEFTVCVDRFIARADPDGAHDHRDDAIEHRDAHVSDVAGMVDITAHGGDGVSTGELIAIFERFNQAEYDTDIRTRRDEYGDTADQHPLPRTAPQRRFDAIATIFHTAAAATGVGSITDPLVNILIDASSWTNLLTAAGLTPSTNNPNTDNPNVGGLQVADRDLLAELLGSPVPLSQRRCETSTGIQLHPHDVLRAALAGHVRRVVVDSAEVVIDMGRRQRLFTGAAREAAQLLVLRCDHPGCELPAHWCDIDHAVEWANGGTTDQTNSGIECNTHNTTKTKRRWRTKRADNNRRYTIRPDGTIMLPVGVRPPTFPGEPDDDAVDHHDDIDDIEQLERIARARLAAHSAA
jgi:hypothetical protein